VSAPAACSGGIGCPSPGAVRTVQCIELADVPGAFDTWGQPETLERLLHAYFSVAARSLRPLVRVRWRAGRPTLVLAGLKAPLIDMGLATTESSDERRAISVMVEGGILVSATSSARLTLALARSPPLVWGRVELVGYHPRGARWSIVRWMYAVSQGQLHVWVSGRFLRELRRAWAAGATSLDLT